MKSKVIDTWIPFLKKNLTKEEYVGLTAQFWIEVYDFLNSKEYADFF